MEGHHHSDCSRDSYIRGTPKPTGLYYDLPGMADKMGSRASFQYAFKQSGGERDSFTKEHKRSDLHYNIPGMSDSIKKDPRGTYAFKGNGGRNAFQRTATGRATSAVYDVPGMAEALEMSPKGRLAFRSSSTRDSYIRGTPKPTGLYYDLPGMADKMGSRASFQYAFKQSGGERDSFTKEHKRSDLHYNIPGMSDSIKKDPRGTYAFKGNGGRNSYVDPFKRETSTAVYNTPDFVKMSDKPYGRFHSCCSNCTVLRKGVQIHPTSPPKKVSIHNSPNTTCDSQGITPNTSFQI